MERPQGSDPGAAPRRPFIGGAARFDSTLSSHSLGILACALLGTAGLLSGACTGHRKPVTPAPAGEVIQRGQASWYGAKFNGRRTASGERYDMRELTAAHPSLPFGTLVQVTNVENGRQVVVRINDRGPFKRRRVIDVSYAAARQLGLVGAGTARVELALAGEDLRPEPVQPLVPIGVAVADLEAGPHDEPPAGAGGGGPGAAAAGAAAGQSGGSARPRSAAPDASAAGVSARAAAAAGALRFVPIADVDRPAGAEDEIEPAASADPGPPPEPVHARAEAAAVREPATALAARPAGAASAPAEASLAGGAAGSAGPASGRGAARVASPSAARVASQAAVRGASSASRPGLTPRTARPVGGLRYTVQVGAFGEPERAEALQQQLAARYPQAAVRSDGIWSRVQVGIFANREEAETLRRELADTGLEALVTTAP
jgi:rare lipoprotein A